MCVSICVFVNSTGGFLECFYISPPRPPPDTLTEDLSEDTMEHLLLEPGDALKLRCDTPARPGGAVTWYKGAARLPPSARIQMRGVVMEMADVTYEDSGVYACACRGTKQPLRNFTITVAGRCHL